MPSLDLKKNELRYTAQDLRLLAECSVLLESMEKYDRAAKDDAATGAVAVKCLWAHVNRKRSGSNDPTPKPPTKAA